MERYLIFSLILLHVPSSATTKNHFLRVITWSEGKIPVSRTTMFRGAVLPRSHSGDINSNQLNSWLQRLCPTMERNPLLVFENRFGLAIWAPSSTYLYYIEGFRNIHQYSTSMNRKSFFFIWKIFWNAFIQCPK